MGFTDHDRNISFDSTLFAAAAGLIAASVESSLGFAVSGTEVSGILNSTQINEPDLSAGLYDGASVEIWKVNWGAPTQRILLDVAAIGEVRRTGNAFTAELRSLSHVLDQERGSYFQSACSATLGDQRCGVDLQSGAYSRTGEITGGDGRLELIADIAAFDAGYFDNGMLTILDGSLAGVTRSIESCRAGTIGTVIKLWSRLPSEVVNGVDVRVDAGCSKTLAACRDKFANQLRFRGFPHIPGNDALMSHITSSSTGLDGGSLLS